MFPDPPTLKKYCTGPAKSEPSLVLVNRTLVSKYPGGGISLQIQTSGEFKKRIYTPFKRVSRRSGLRVVSLNIPLRQTRKRPLSEHQPLTV